MHIENTHLAYFSPTFTTEQTVRTVAQRLPGRILPHDMMGEEQVPLVALGPNDLLVVGVPVFSGRVPSIAADALESFSGLGTKAIAICVYGNRAYEDALLELCDLLASKGFVPIAAAAFIAQHSIFEPVAEGRPDAKDWERMMNFGTNCAKLLEAIDADVQTTQLRVKGSRPYRQATTPPFHPAGSSKKCLRCGRCVRECPVGAINEKKPYHSDSSLCISCGHCVAICPAGTRCFSGYSFKSAQRRMLQTCSDYKQPEMFYASVGGRTNVQLELM